MSYIQLTIFQHIQEAKNYQQCLLSTFGRHVFHLVLLYIWHSTRHRQYTPVRDSGIWTTRTAWLSPTQWKRVAAVSTWSLVVCNINSNSTWWIPSVSTTKKGKLCKLFSRERGHVRLCKLCHVHVVCRGNVGINATLVQNCDWSCG